MAAFGEINEPSSRATWEDGDCMGNGHHFPGLHWRKPLDIPAQVNKFFIFEGKCLWNGVRAKRTLQEVNCVKDADLHLYKTPQSQHFIAVIRDCDLLMCNDVVRLLKDLITKSKMVVTVQEKPMSEYKTNQPPPTCQVIRKITTTNTVNLMRENIQKLEQPNIITGVSAGVFSLREHLGLSATAIVIFMEHTEDNQVEDIENLLQKMDMSGTAQINQNIALNSNLYT